MNSVNNRLHNEAEHYGRGGGQRGEGGGDRRMRGNLPEFSASPGLRLLWASPVGRKTTSRCDITRVTLWFKSEPPKLDVFSVCTPTLRMTRDPARGCHLSPFNHWLDKYRQKSDYRKLSPRTVTLISREANLNENLSVSRVPKNLQYQKHSISASIPPCPSKITVCLCLMLLLCLRLRMVILLTQV